MSKAYQPFVLSPSKDVSRNNVPIRGSSRSSLAGIAVGLWETAVYVTLLITAAAMRFWDLGSRAMHHDESLHAYYSWRLSEGMGFRHDPMMHGPLQFESNAAVFFILGDGDVTARLLYAVAGVALVGMPWLLRARLGRIAALATATLLAFSPSLLYFSRFARNDILAAVWTLGLVICLWRYLDEGRNRYLYLGAVLLALFFATKETAFIVVTILGFYLAATVVLRRLAVIRRAARIDRASYAELARRMVIVAAAYARRGLRPSRLSRESVFLLMLFTLALPQGAAFVSVLQDTPLLRWAGLTLARTVDSGGPIGAPLGGGLVIAGVVVFGLLAISMRLGNLWRWSVWWRYALIFYVVWVLLYSTFFTNINGIGSGWWQSLGYWLAQQEVARGNQPWYYYFVLTPIYEFLPLLFAAVAGVYYLWRKDKFGRFLVYWVIATFIMYTVASEKMPWLLVNLALPLIVLSGKFLADVAGSIEWGRLVPAGGLLLLPGVPALLWVLWRLAFYDVEPGSGADVAEAIGLGVVAATLVGAGVVLARRSGLRNFAAFATIPVALVLLVLTIRVGAIAVYQNGDRPVEMIVYTQSSPDLPRLMEQIEGAGEATGQGFEVPISVDGTGGFAWPWAWYLRAYTQVGYPSFQFDPPSEAPDSAVVVVHRNNQPVFIPLLGEEYKEGVRIRHRWWFPEHTYRDLTVTKIVKSFADRGAWRRAMDYFMHRRLSSELGSEDAYVYFAQDLPQHLEESED